MEPYLMGSGARQYGAMWRASTEIAKASTVSACRAIGRFCCQRRLRAAAALTLEHAAKAPHVHWRAGGAQ